MPRVFSIRDVIRDSPHAATVSVIRTAISRPILFVFIISSALAKPHKKNTRRKRQMF